MAEQAGENVSGHEVRALRSRAKMLAKQEQVWRLRMINGLTIATIAEALGMGERTVVTHLAAMRKLATEYWEAQNRDRLQAARDALIEVEAHQQEVLHAAWADYQRATPGSGARARFLRVVQEAICSRVKYLVTLGVVPKVAQEITLSGTEVDKRIHQLTDEEIGVVLASIDLALNESREAGADEAGDPAPGAGAG